MEKIKFKELLKIKTPYEIIRSYYKSEINLTKEQLEKLIKVPNDKRKVIL